MSFTVEPLLIYKLSNIEFKCNIYITTYDSTVISGVCQFKCYIQCNRIVLHFLIFSVEIKAIIIE